MRDQKELLKLLLRGIETGSAASAAVVNEAKYIQHNPQTHEGSEGLAVLFARLAQTHPKVEFVRVFSDGDFAFAHNLYDFSSKRAAFEVFRFEDGPQGHQAVEHWDNIQPLEGPNPPGRGMLDGAAAVTDLDKTEDNRALVRAFTETVLIGGDIAQAGDAMHEDLIQHGPKLMDGRAAFLADFGPGKRRYETLHRVLAEGNFVLTMTEGWQGEAHASFYDLYRVAQGQIVEHWETIEKIAPKSEWKNNNGKF